MVLNLLRKIAIHTVGRANSDYTVVASIGDTVYEPVGGVYTIPAIAEGVLTLRCSVRVSERLMALPTAERKENESGYLSIK